MRRKKKLDLWKLFKEITPTQYEKILEDIRDNSPDCENWDMWDFCTLLESIFCWDSFFHWIYITKCRWGDWDDEIMVQFIGTIETPEWVFQVVIDDWYENPPTFETEKELADYIVKLWDRYLDTIRKFRIMTSHIKYTYVD